jgi:hypothetical protein
LGACGVKTDLGLEQFAWRLALTESGDSHLLGDLAERFVDIAVKFDFVNFDDELDFVAFETLNRTFHRAQSVPLAFVTASWKPHALASPHEGQINMRIGDKVTSIVEIEGVPVGTEGRVILANGFNWLRYRIAFANGREVGDLDHRHIAPIGKTAKRLAKQSKRAS